MVLFYATKTCSLIDFDFYWLPLSENSNIYRRLVSCTFNKLDEETIVSEFDFI